MTLLAFLVQWQRLEVAFRNRHATQSLLRSSLRSVLSLELPTIHIFEPSIQALNKTACSQTRSDVQYFTAQIPIPFSANSFFAFSFFTEDKMRPCRSSGGTS